jgi:sulfatase modifying factor 1
MENMLKKSGKPCILFFIILILSTLLPSPMLAFEKVFRNSLGMEFVLIPAGTFVMGSPPDEPNRGSDEIQHKVTISRPFYMQNTEVTLKQWRAVMGKRFLSSRKGADNMPVVKISWHDCIRFMKKLNVLGQWSYRLPTEAEWEYACRAGSSTAYSWGNTIDCGRAMYGNNSLKSRECLDYVRSRGLTIDQPTPVKSYLPNAWGLYDMHGNVWEWCRDWHGDYTRSAKIDPFGPDSGTMRVRRGGSWFKYGYTCRSANRNYAHPSSRYQTTGFRLVRREEADWNDREEGNY